MSSKNKKSFKHSEDMKLFGEFVWEYFRQIVDMQISMKLKYNVIQDTSNFL